MNHCTCRSRIVGSFSTRGKACMHNAARRVIFAGAIAGLINGIIEMVSEGIAGAGFWSPVVFIAATVQRQLQVVPVPVPFLPLPVVLGLAGHLINSVILTAIFALLVAPRLGDGDVLVLGGIVYGLGVFAVLWFGIVPLVDPVFLKLNAPVFAVAHIAWGATIAIMLTRHHLPRLLSQRAHA
jgi:hypothetical protein